VILANIDKLADYMHCNYVQEHIYMIKHTAISIFFNVCELIMQKLKLSRTAVQ